MQWKEGGREERRKEEMERGMKGGKGEEGKRWNPSWWKRASLAENFDFHKNFSPATEVIVKVRMTE